MGGPAHQGETKQWRGAKGCDPEKGKDQGQLQDFQDRGLHQEGGGQDPGGRLPFQYRTGQDRKTISHSPGSGLLLETTLGCGSRTMLHAMSPTAPSKHIHDFVSKDAWPPSSPDLNPMDYFFCGVLGACTNRAAHSIKASLINSIKEEAAMLEKSMVKFACSSL